MKYRVKTKEEFINEFGENWRNVRRGGLSYFAECVDCLFGVEINSIDYDVLIYDSIQLQLHTPQGTCNRFDLYNDNLYIRHNSGWYLSMDSLIQISVDYNEKKVLVYD